MLYTLPVQRFCNPSNLSKGHPPMKDKMTGLRASTVYNYYVHISLAGQTLLYLCVVTGAHIVHSRHGGSKEKVEGGEGKEMSHPQTLIITCMSCVSSTTNIPLTFQCAQEKCIFLFLPLLLLFLCLLHVCCILCGLL